MNVTVAKYAGFCFGVERAVSATKELIKKSDEKQGRIYTLGDLIHNPKVIAELRECGVHSASMGDIDALNVQHGGKMTVIIRTHGIPKGDSERLRAFEGEHDGCKLIDCTCPYVKKIHEIAERESMLPGRIGIIIGNESHPEVQGIMSYFSCPTKVFSNCDEMMEYIGTISPNLVPIHVAQTT